MVLVLPPSLSSFHLPKINSSIANTGCRNEALHSSDTFHLQRGTLLKMLEDSILFEAVLDETHKPTPQVKALRQMLAKQKISTQELFTSPAMLANFYEHLAIQAENQLEKATTKQKREELLLQAAMMRSLVAEIRNPKPPGSLSHSLKTAEASINKESLPKFGGIESLFAQAMKLLTDKGNWRGKKPAVRKKQCEKIINIGSILAGATAGALTKIMFADDAALTAVTVGTITRMAYGVYGIEDTSPAALGVIIGKVCGARIADGLLSYAIEKGLSYIPFLGELATASTAFTLHQATGRMFMHYFENQIKEEKEPGFPLTVRALLAGFNLANATHIVDQFHSETLQDLDSAIHSAIPSQTEHYNALNDFRVEHGDFHATSHTVIETGQNSIEEIHNIVDKSGKLIGIPGKEDFLNSVLSAASGADDVVGLVKTLSTTPYGLTKKIIQEMNKNHKISGETMVSLLSYGSSLKGAELVILGGPNTVQNPGYLKQFSDFSNSENFKKFVHEHFNVANGLNIDPMDIAAWATQGGFTLANSPRAKSLKDKILARAQSGNNVTISSKPKKAISITSTASQSTLDLNTSAKKGLSKVIISDPDTLSLRKQAVMRVAQNECRPPKDPVKYYDLKRGKWIYSSLTTEQAEDLRTAYYFKEENNREVDEIRNADADFHGYYSISPDEPPLCYAIERKHKSDSYFDAVYEKALNSFYDFTKSDESLVHTRSIKKPNPEQNSSNSLTADRPFTYSQVVQLGKTVKQ